MKYTRSLFGLAMLLGLIVVVASNIPESTYAQMNMSAPSAAATNGFNSASAQEQQFIANLSGSKNVPPINTPATGVAKFTVSADGKSLSYIVSVRNINSVIGSHIHFGDATIKDGPKVLYLFGNPSMTGPPTGKVNGILSKGNSTASDLKGPLDWKRTV